MERFPLYRMSLFLFQTNIVRRIIGLSLRIFSGGEHEDFTHSPKYSTMETNVTHGNSNCRLVALLFCWGYYSGGKVIHQPTLLRHVIPASDLKLLAFLKRVDKLLKIRSKRER